MPCLENFTTRILLSYSLGVDCLHSVSTLTRRYEANGAPAIGKQYCWLVRKITETRNDSHPMAHLLCKSHAIENFLDVLPNTNSSCHLFYFFHISFSEPKKNLIEHLVDI